jgi:hypothetical protein
LYILASALSTYSVVHVVAVLLLVGVVVLWWRSWTTWEELRTDWRDLRRAAENARANRKEREAFANGKSCPRCLVPLNPRRLYRAVHSGQASGADVRWVYRCKCGESTLYDDSGKGRHLESASAA